MDEKQFLHKHVLPLWVPSISLESPPTPFLEEIKILVMDYARRIAETEIRPRLRLPDQGPTKLGTGIRQVEAWELPAR
jgi:hypothetical protein